MSSFVASLFLGEFSPMDWSDASGTNLFDIRSKDWKDELLEVRIYIRKLRCLRILNLKEKLPGIVINYYYSSKGLRTKVAR